MGWGDSANGRSDGGGGTGTGGGAAATGTVTDPSVRAHAVDMRRVDVVDFDDYIGAVPTVGGRTMTAPRGSADFDTFAGLLGGGGDDDAPPPPSKRPRTGTHKVTIERTVGDPTAAAAAAWKPVEFKREPTWSRGRCFGCEYGYPGATAPGDAQPALQGLWKLFKDNYGKEMGNNELAGLMHVFFVENIRDPMAAQGHTVTWPVAMILEHIEVHMLEPTVNCGTAIQNLKCVERWLRDQVRLKNAQGQYKVDLKCLKALLDVQRQIQVLYNAKPTRQLFYSDYLKLDQRREHQRE